MCRAWAEGGALSGGGAYLAVELEEKLAEEEGLGGGGGGGESGSEPGRPASITGHGDEKRVMLKASAGNKTRISYAAVLLNSL